MAILLLPPAPATATSESTSQEAGLIVVDAPSGPDVTTTSSDWANLPHMVGDITLGSTSDLAITFCAETYATNDKRVFVRALVGGQPASPGDVVLVLGETAGTRCFTFVKNGVAAGTHTVRIQWRVDSGGTAHVGDRTLHITFAQSSADELALLAVAAPSGSDQVTTGGWSDIPDMNGTIQLPAASDLAISFSAEAYATNDKRLFIRALVDGQAASPSDEVLVTGGYTGTRTFTFVKQNVGAGSHNIKIQWWVDAEGEGHAGDRTLRVVGVRRSGAKDAGRLMVAAPSGSARTTTSISWENMPDMSGSIHIPAAGDIVIGFSAEIWASTDKRVFVRALVDGQPISPSDVVIISGGRGDSYTFAFVKRNVSHGNHTLQLQWHTDSGGQANVGDRTLVAYTFAQPYQTSWTQLPDIDSYTSPVLSDHTDGKIYAVAVAFNGLVAYSSTDTPGGWASWQILGPAPASPPLPDPAFYADPNTPPVLARDGNTLYLFVRGKDNNLHETHKVGSSNWSSWQALTSDGRVRGRLYVALTRPSGTLDIHVVYTSESNTVEYRQFGSDWAQAGSTEQWSNALEGTIATDGVNEVWTVIRTTDRMLLIEKKSRPWSSPWQSVAGRLADGSQGEFFDISNVIYFGGAYHIAYSIKYLCDDVSGTYCHALAHTRIRAGLPDDGYVRWITDYTPQDGSYPQPALVIYRNKLVMAYKDQAGYVRYAYWDNTDSETPWIGGDVIDASTKTEHRPALTTLNKRTGSGALAGNDYLEANFGNDLFAAINEATTNSIWFINFSRAFFALRIDEIGLAVKWCAEYEGTFGDCPDVGGLPAISEVPVFTEAGYGTITTPDWLMSRIYWRGLAAGGNPTGRYNTWIHTQPIRAYIGPNLNIDYLSDYLRWWEEMGHSLTGGLGICDDGYCPSGTNTPGPNLMSDFIPDSVRDNAFTLFAERVNPDCISNEPDDTCPATRVRGFTGIAGNYDVGTRQHSWMYVLYYHIGDGDLLRGWIQDDQLNGQTESERTLLQRKYDWIKQYIFQDAEFRKDSEPRVLPVNNAFATATEIASAPFSWTRNTAEATSDAADPVIQCGNRQHGHTVWFRYTPPNEGTLTASTNGSDYDTVLAAWTGQWGALASVTCQDDVSESDATSTITATVTGGTPIYLEVAAYGESDAGQLEFDLAFQTTGGVCLGDLTGDNTVDINDVMQAANGWRKQAGEAGYDARVDRNGDNTITVDEVQWIAAQWGVCQ